MPATTLTSAQQGSAIVTAAHRAGIPAAVLLGVYGQETGFGSNIATSSAGAQGAFQFIPSTARTWNYPLTNTPTLAQFQQQANAAAAYLASLYKAHGNNWNAAIQGYGGGYGVQDVANQAAHAPLDLIDAVIGKGISLGTGDTSVTGGTPLTAAAQQGSNTVQGAVSSASDLIGMVTSTAFWLRVAEAIAGFVLLVLGLHALTGLGDGTVSSLKKTAPAFL